MAGRGAAVAAGIREARGDTVIIQDADLELDPADIPAMLQRMHNENLDLVSGTRFAKIEMTPGPCCCRCSNEQTCLTDSTSDNRQENH